MEVQIALAAVFDLGCAGNHEGWGFGIFSDGDLVVLDASAHWKERHNGVDGGG